MARMTPLNPAPSAKLPGDGWELIATEAGRYATGLRATVQAWNGSLQGSSPLVLAQPKSWTTFAEVVATQAGCPSDDVIRALLTLTVGVEGILRQRKKAAPSGSGHAEEPPHPAEVGTDALPWIDAGQANLRIVTREAWDALQQANAAAPQFFRHAGVPVRLETDDDRDLFPSPLTADRMRHVLARVANWYRDMTDPLTGASIRQIVRPPADVVRDVLAAPDPPLPVLRRIVEVPVFAPDGTLQTTPGYHPGSRTYYLPHEGFTLDPVPDQPTARDVKFAKALMLGEVLPDFPFVTDADRAHAVALWLLPFCRDLIDGPTPLHLIEAPCAGSGKGLLAEVCLLPAIGHRFGTLSPGRDDEEWRKSITTALRWGHEAIWIDNITQPLKSGDLAAALTSPMWEDRILGQSTSVRIPVRCVWMATANNPVLSEELTRRSVRIRIDPKVDRPWLREGFQHENLREWVQAHRATLVGAALTFVRAWLASGRPPPDVRPLGSYEAWSRVIGGILEVAGLEGFLGNLTEFYDVANTEAAAWRAFVAAWWATYPTTPVTTRELLPTVVDFEELGVSGKDERAQATSLGKKLVQQRDRVIGEHQIIWAGVEHQAKKWRLHLLTSENPSPPSPDIP
ncbi:MAG: hypothetical protein HYZ81_17540 [Nitrospinae bacterium]|nr:hypothetical protein [Nitrospinota bacterium]